MPSFLADHNIEGHCRLLFDQIRRSAWSDMADALDFRYFTFADVGIGREATDRVVWRECQRSGLILITDNRNADGPESLEVVIREELTAESLPVLTISQVAKIYRDRDYVERVVVKLIEIAVELDAHRGAGRMYLP